LRVQIRVQIVMAKPLTAKAVENARPGNSRRELHDAGAPGLFLMVQTTGAKSWAYRWRQGGKYHKVTVGPAIASRQAPIPAGPDIGEAHTLAEAREKATTFAALVAEGDSPSDYLRRAPKPASDEADTVEAISRLYVSQWVEVKNKPSYQSEIRRQLKQHVIPAWGAKRVGRVAQSDVAAMIARAAKENGGIAANRLLACVRKLFSWAVSQGYVAANPAAAVVPPASEKPRERVLSRDELRAVWRASLSDLYPFGPLVRFLILTGQRRDECANALWSEIVGDIWTVPSERTKNGKPSVVPLSAVVIDLLDSLPRFDAGPWLFTTAGKSPFSGFSKRKALFDKVSGVTGYTLHDLRRTMASGLAELGCPIHIVEAILNHRSGTISGVAAIYNRHTYLEEKREWLEKWAVHCTAFEDRSRS